MRPARLPPASRLGVLLLVLLTPLALAACGRTAGGSAAPRGPARLVLVEPVMHLGRVPAGRARVVALPWRRLGVGSLRLLAVESDCGCAVVDAHPGPVPPGARGRLRVRFGPRDTPGPFAVGVRVYTDARPPDDLVRGRLVGWVRAPLALRPPRLDLGRRTPGREVERTIEVRWPEDAAPAGLVPRLAGLPGRVALEPLPVHGRAGCLLRLVLRAPAEPGPFRGRVLLRRAGRVVATLPVRGVSVPRPGSPGRDPPR
jgi:hypothetical protein